MRACIQRVSQASVTVDGEIVGQIEQGLVVLLGVAGDDEESDVEHLAEKTTALRIFEDEGGKMNRSLIELGGAMLEISARTQELANGSLIDNADSIAYAAAYRRNKDPG